MQACLAPFSSPLSLPPFSPCLPAATEKPEKQTHGGSNHAQHQIPVPRYTTRHYREASWGKRQLEGPRQRTPKMSWECLCFCQKIRECLKNDGNMSKGQSLTGQICNNLGVKPYQ